MKIPTDYRGFIRLAKKRNVKLTPGGTSAKKGCLMTLISIAFLEDGSFLPYTRGQDYAIENLGLDKTLGLEDGFEDCLKTNETATYNRYYKVGQRLREYALANSGKVG